MTVKFIPEMIMTRPTSASSSDPSSRRVFLKSAVGAASAVALSQLDIARVAHAAALGVPVDVLADPACVGLLGPQAVVAVAQHLAHLVQQARWRWIIGVGYPVVSFHGALGEFSAM